MESAHHPWQHWIASQQISGWWNEGRTDVRSRRKEIRIVHPRHTGSGLKLPIELELGNILSGENIKPNEEWRNLRYSNPGHIGVKRVLSSLRQPSILDKNVKKNACCVSNFRMLPSKPRSLKILPHFRPPPPLPKKNNVEVWPEYFCSRLNNIDHEGGEAGVTMAPNSQGGSPVRKKVQNS